MARHDNLECSTTPLFFSQMIKAVDGIQKANMGNKAGLKLKKKN
jgi:hypothetical protein